MGLFSNLFSKKQETPTPVPQAELEAPKTKGVIKIQRHKLDNIDAHMKDIMELVEKNEDYKLSKKALIEDVRDDEKIYEYELNATAKCCIGGGGEIQVFVSDTYIGDIKKGSRAKVKKLLESGTIQRIDAEVSGGNYKILKNVNDSYIVDELEDAFSITIEITYREEIKEEQ